MYVGTLAVQEAFAIKNCRLHCRDVVANTTEFLCCALRISGNAAFEENEISVAIKINVNGYVGVLFAIPQIFKEI